MTYTEFVKFPKENVDALSSAFAAFISSGQPCNNEFARQCGHELTKEKRM